MLPIQKKVITFAWLLQRVSVKNNLFVENMVDLNDLLLMIFFDVLNYKLNAK
jgi:hypothetical protein